MNASANGPDSILSQIDPTCDAFEAAQKAATEPRIEDFIGDVPDFMRSVLLRHLLLLELEYGCRRGEQATVEDYVARFPNDRQVVVDAFHDFACERQPMVDEPAVVGLHIRCPRCHNHVELAVDVSFEDITCSSCGLHFGLANDPMATEDASELATIGHFELIERLGIGGFGTVWKARDTQLDRTVAIKIPRKGQLEKDELEKFFREARSAAQLHHPNIVGVHEVGRDGDAVYIVSDFVRGVSLSSWLSGKSMTFRGATELCAKIADALHHAHENNVIHRDLKPQNIIIDACDEPHLTDFGLAKRETGEITMTLDGQVLGTPAYMPPEQASGGGHMADRRADIYSLGVILFQLLSGELPFRGNRNMLIHQVVHDEPSSPRRFNSSIPRDLETICLKCLAKERSQRYPRASDLADDLRRFLHGEPILARPLRRITRVARWCRRNPTIAGLLFAVVGSLAIGLLLSSYFAWTARTALREVAKTETEKTKALTDALLNGSRAMRQARREGYRQEVYRVIQQALDLGTLKPHEIDLLRTEAVGAMGDFVGLPPIDYAEFPGDIKSINFHPRADFFALGFSNGTVRLVQRETGTVISVLTRHDSAVIATAIARNGKMLVTADSSGRVLFQVLERDGHWATTRTLEIGAGIESIGFNEGCQTLVARSLNNTKIWDLTRGTEITTYFPQQLLMRSAVLSPDKTLLVVGYKDEQTTEEGIVVWNVRDQKEEQRIPLDFGDAYPNSLTFSPDGKLFAYGCDSAMIIYELPSFNRLSLRRTDAIIAAAFSPDSQSLAAYDIRGGIAIWSVTTGEKTAILSHRRRRPSDHWLAFSADGTHLAAATADSVRTWNLAGAVERRGFEGHLGPVPSVAYSPNGDLVASASKDHTVSFWDPLTRERVATLSGFPAAVQSVAFAPNGRLVATAYWGPDNSIQIWDVKTQRPIGSATHDLDLINRLAFEANGLRLAAAGDAGIAVWDVDMQSEDKDELRAVLKPSLTKSGVKCLDIAWSSDGRFLAWPDNQTHVRVWDFDSNGYRDVNAPRMLQGWHGLAFLPDSHRFAFVNFQRGLQIWDAREDRSCFVGEADRFQAPHLAVNYQGTTLAGLTESGTVGIWDVNSHEQLFALRSERTAVWSLAWSPDGTHLAVGLADGGLAVWDLQRIRQELATLGLSTGATPR